MKREKPDPLHFALWAAANLDFDQRSRWPAWGLWNHWTEYADKIGVRRGSRRAFSNALRRIGSPWTRGFDAIEDHGAWFPKRRMHQGVRLALPRLPSGTSAEVYQQRYERYG